MQIPASSTNAFKVVSDLMMNKMMLSDKDRDMVVLKHIFQASYGDGRSEVISSRLIDYGSLTTDTSISRTVALPAAVAVKLILEGRIDLKGVYRPVKREIYEPVLSELEKLGIKTIEKYGLPESEAVF